MKEIVDWLIEIEEIAGKLYEGASGQFANDKILSLFLSDLAEDEGWHYHIMGSAAEYLRKEKSIKSEIVIDSTIKARIEGPFTSTYNMLSMGTLTKDSIIDCVIETEYSEWNHIFLYVVNTLKQRSREFMYVASKMQHHIDEITEYIKSLPDPNKYIDRISSLPEVWKKSFLIVEDYEPIRVVLKELLKDEGNVETVDNGKEALKRVTHSYYDIIVSDIEMPLMDGIEFCKQALKLDSDISKRIIFCSSSYNDEFMKFISDNNIRLLRKPINISDLHGHVREILSKIALTG